MSGEDRLTVALAKGRLAEDALALFAAAGYDVSCVDESTRRLIFESGSMRYILVKPADVPTYVEHGIADIGIVGKDTLMEENRQLYEMLDLELGKCRLCVAGFAEGGARPMTTANVRVATKYPSIARSYYEARGVNVDIIKLNGSVELGPLVGLSDTILDIVESGSTLKVNGLAVLEEICDISARLAVNRVSLKVKGELIRPLIEGLKAAVRAKKEKNDA